MIQTPQFVFDKTRFIQALDKVPDFNRSLFDCVAGIKKETNIEKMVFQDIEMVIHDTKRFAAQWLAKKHPADMVESRIYLCQVLFFIKRDLNSLQASEFINLWKAIYLLFPHKDRPVDSKAAFALFGDLPTILPDEKARYHALHAFAYNAGLTQDADKKRALTVLSKNENATIADLKNLMVMRSDMDDKLSADIIQKVQHEIEVLNNLPAAERDNHLSDDGVLTRHEAALKNLCSEGKEAACILRHFNARKAIDAQRDFDGIIKELDHKKEVVDLKPGEKMPDINDLSQFPHYAALLKQVKEEEKIKGA